MILLAGCFGLYYQVEYRARYLFTKGIHIYPNILTGLPMEVLMWRDLIFCHPFFNKETKKLIDMLMFCLSSSSLMLTVPTAVPIQRTFLSWNLTVLLSSLTLSSTFSFSPIATGNFPILVKTLPSNLGICFIKDSEAIKIS